jgi:hypothetical protein
MACPFNEVPSIQITRENIKHLSRLGVLDRVKVPVKNDTKNDVGETSSFDRDKFVKKFVDRTRYFVEEVLPYDSKLNNFWFCLLVKRCRITTCVARETKSVTVHYNFQLDSELLVVVDKWTNEMISLNKLLAMTFDGANLDPKWRFICQATMDSTKLVFEWKYKK